MGSENDQWPFWDPPNVAVFTTLRILDGVDRVQYVTHDEEDGAWQFHSAASHPTIEKAADISLRHMLEIEPRIAELADLPTGWHAWRDDVDGQWMRDTRPLD